MSRTQRMVETIAIYFSVLPSTKLAAAFGLGVAYHMAIVYTNSAGESFGVSSGPSNQMSAQTPAKAFLAIAQSAVNEPSGFGTLISDPKNNRAFQKRHPKDFYTQDEEGNGYPHVTALAGKDLSSKWRVIVKFYAGIDRYRLTYSPITQNSNTVAGMALRQAHIPIPFSSETHFAPGAFTSFPPAPAPVLAKERR